MLGLRSPAFVARLGEAGFAFDPAALFAMGEDGARYDATAPAALFTDTAGTTASAPDDLVALVADLSGNDVDAVQASAALRPLHVTPTALRFDEVDDVMASSLSGTFDVMVFGRGGSWIERDVIVASSLAIGPDSFTGAIPGVMEALGDIVGWVAVDRSLSEIEVVRLVQYYRARGAKGLLVPGPELVTNGDFSAGTTGWDLGIGWEVSGGALRKIVWQGGSFQRAQQFMSLSGDTPYLFNFDLSGLIREFIVGFQWSGSPTARHAVDVATEGTINFVLRAPPEPTNITIRPDASPAAGVFENVSLRELRPEEDW